MFSQYMYGSFAPLSSAASPVSTSSKQEKTKKNDVLTDFASGLTQILSSIGRQFSAGSLDTGDILLVLIILFLFLEGDNLELVITLGLMILFGFND